MLSSETHSLNRIGESIMLPTQLSKYGIEVSLMDATPGVKALCAKAWELDQAVKNMAAAQSAASDPNAPKVVPVYDKAAKGNEEAEMIARTLVRKFIQSCAEAIEDNNDVAYWLAELDKEAAQFNTTELQFFRWQADKQAAPVKPANEALNELRTDRKELVQFAKKLAGLVPTVVDELVEDKEAVRFVKKGKNGWELSLPNIQGRGAGDAETTSPVGKFASLSYMQWCVDDETFPVGTDSRIILRAIFTGADRTGKRPADLYDAMMAANGGSAPKNAGDKVSFVLGGCKVTGTRVDLSESDDEDSSDDE